ncbi:hypothetical protein CI238_12243 [Colletotrichum incanum]|uniref:Uncharacterized protein n=1 Tax=Colletotrichum incanum TaxID=1573173 RepID=A0A167ACZ6_COLIC|nr:hypothetical protein CI238_12243 [Colletotrichum incanum]
MAPRRKKAISVIGKNTTEQREGAEYDAGDVTQKERMMSSLPTEKGPGENDFRRLPIEIRQMVYALAVIEDEPIEPFQVEDRANKFIGGKTATKTFPSLLLTCRTVYEEVISRLDFYRDLTNFLAALSPARRAMICKIKFALPYWDEHRSTSTLESTVTLLSHCTSFQSLSIVVPIRTWIWSIGVSPETVLRQLLQLPTHAFHIKPDGNDWRRLRTASVQHFELSIAGCPVPQPWQVLFGSLGVSADHGKLRFSGEHGFVSTNAALVKQVQRLNTCLLELGTHCSPKYAIDKPIVGSRLQEALSRSNIDVYGDNRVGQSHQSGMVSCGTRSRKLRMRQVTSNGVLSKVAKNSKYIDAYEDDIVEA